MARDRSAYGPGRVRIGLFLAGLAAYYALYAAVFVDRMKDYLRDVERHFAFAFPIVGILRRLLGAP
jgi:hypothetical protein